MRRKLAALLLALAGLAASQGPRAQDLLVTLTDGSQIRGHLEGLAGRGREANLLLAAATGTRTLPLRRVLSLQGRGPKPVDGTIVRLVGGDRLQGEMAGGDTAGETFTIVSRSLGPRRVPVDRVEVMLFGAHGVGADALRMPAGIEADEALFRKARRGFDTIPGAIHRFTARGVVFEWSEEEEPRLFPYLSLIGLGLRGGDRPPKKPAARLVTRSGDVLGVDIEGVTAERLRLRGEDGRPFSVAMAEVSALTLRSPDRVFLSDLEPARVEQRGSHFADGGQPLYRFARDRSVTGGFLIAGGHGYGKGLGVHARCVLVYRVPQGFTRFLTLVALDDEVSNLPVRAEARVVIKLDEKVVFGPLAVQSGRGPRASGVLKVRPGALLTLEVDFGEGWFLGDRVDWLSPVFLR